MENCKKIVILIVCIVFFFGSKLRADNWDDFRNFTASLVQQKQSFIGHQLQYIYSAMYAAGISPRWASTVDTSPWKDPRGKPYIQGIVLYSNGYNEIMHSDAEYVELVISLEETNCESTPFWRGMPDDVSRFIDAFIECTRSFIIQGVKYRVTKISDLEKDVRTEYIE